MKKTLATIITVGALVASSYAQGTVNFANAAASVVKQWTTLTDSTLINVPVGGGRVELLWAAVGTTDLNLFSSTGATPGFIAPGRFSGGTITIPTTVAGSGVALVVRGWTGSSLTWAGINPLTDQAGYSSIFTLASTGNPTTVPPGTPASINPAFTGLTVVPIPEPSSMVLAGLGAASLLLFRRR
jgi:hypothetical protein